MKFIIKRIYHLFSNNMQEENLTTAELLEIAKYEKIQAKAEKIAAPIIKMMEENKLEPDESGVIEINGVVFIKQVQREMDLVL